MRTQLHKAEGWIAEKVDEAKHMRMERDAATLELAILRKAYGELQLRAGE